MLDPSFLLVAIFLPIFPFSIVFNAIFAKVRHPWLRVFLLLGWPLVGILLFQVFAPQVAQWLVPMVVFTAVFYAFRLLAMREVGIWTGFLATSVWACFWLPLLDGDQDILLYVVWFGVPLATLVLLVGGLEKRFGAAYTNLYGGLAQTIPRFSGVFVVTILAAVATPVFPAFLSMLNIVVASKPAVAIALVGLWALWSWAGMRLIHGMIVGEPSEDRVRDMPMPLTWAFGAMMSLLIVAGFAMTGDL